MIKFRIGELYIMEKRELEKGSIILFILMMLANILNYLFQIIVGRGLNDVTLYSELNTLFSVSNILLMPTSIIALVVSKYIAELNVIKDYERMKGFLIKLSNYIFIGIILVILVGILVSPYLSLYMRIDDNRFMKMIFVISSINLIFPIITGFFQGTKKFFHYGVISCITPIVKLFGSMIFLYIGWKLNGILLSLLFGSILSILVGFLYLKKNFKPIKRKKANIGKEKIFGYFIGTFLANIGLVLLSNIDMILIKHYFNIESGYYSTALVFGKMILYFSSSIVVTLFPLVVEQKNNNKQVIAILKKSLLYGGVLSFCAMIGLNLLGEVLIQILYGNTYNMAIKYIFPVSIMILPMSILTILMNYLLAIDDSRFIIITMIIGVIIEFVTITLFHESIIEVIYTIAAILFSITILNIIRIIFKYKFSSSTI